MKLSAALYTIALATSISAAPAPEDQGNPFSEVLDLMSKVAPGPIPSDLPIPDFDGAPANQTQTPPVAPSQPTGTTLSSLIASAPASSAASAAAPPSGSPSPTPTPKSSVDPSGGDPSDAVGDELENPAFEEGAQQSGDTSPTNGPSPNGGQNQHGGIPGMKQSGQSGVQTSQAA